MKRNQLLLFVPIVIVYVIGMFNDIMEVDASQYAAMSQEMLARGDYIHLYDRGQDYLDKPPLLFWASALSFRLFGISNFTYKLPSVLFSLLGIFATYQLGRKLFGQPAGFYSALILGSCQSWFLMNHDVRTDTILAACTIVGIWQLYVFLESNKVTHLAFASLGIAGAMLTKGPIGLMVPALAIGTHVLVNRDWKLILRITWLLLPVFVLLLLSPMLIGLYQQYDQHPGKLILGVSIQSGLRFYFWTQSFGRLTGENMWKDDTSIFFFTHTFLWAFLPWCILFIVAWSKDTWQLMKLRFHQRDNKTALAWGGFFIPFIAFSLSHYKLPHYIFVLFPLAAIITGHFVDDLLTHQKQRTQEIFVRIQIFVIVLVFALGVMLCGWAFPIQNIFYWIVFFVAVGSVLFFVYRGKLPFDRVILPSYIAIIALNLVLNSHFYPNLMKYASSNQATKAVTAIGETEHFRTLRAPAYGADVYSHQTITHCATVNELFHDYHFPLLWVFTNEQGQKEILDSKIRVISKRRFDNFHVSALSIPFLNPATRAQEVNPTYLLQIEVPK